MTRQDQPTISLDIDTSAMSEQFRSVGENFDRVVREDMKASLNSLDDSVKLFSRSIQRNLVSAARHGEQSFKQMAASIARDMSRLALDRFVGKPVENAVTQILSRIPFGGARANGGAVAPGSAFLVGENGPEIFTPSNTGRIDPATNAPTHININFNIKGATDAKSFQKSETQISAMLARAVRRGTRNM